MNEILGCNFIGHFAIDLSEGLVLVDVSWGDKVGAEVLELDGEGGT